MSEQDRGCGDHSCVTATDKTGQMTNGGCTCSPIALKRYIWKLEQIAKKYNELLLEVVNKVEGMSRHDRAKAIIISAEAMVSREAGRVCKKPTGCKHTIGTSVDEDGCCSSCGEDINHITTLNATKLEREL